MSRRSIESGKALTDELVAVVCSETGQTREAVLAIVRPIARYLDREYGGQNIYKKKAENNAEGRAALLANIKRDLAMRVPKKVICRVHAISASRLYRMIVDENMEPTKPNGSAAA
jgi:hypothetical protein